MKLDNFYLHDSSKGYSHGCIEVEGRFFEDLKQSLIFGHLNKNFNIELQVKYHKQDTYTYGGTGK